MKLLGIDYGDKRIGLAKSAGKTAVPFGIIENNKDTFAHINEVCKKEEIKGIVVGLPKSLGGEPNAQVQTVQDFIAHLKDNIDIDIFTEDERMTSKMSKGDDALAAMQILQSYLERIS